MTEPEIVGVHIPGYKNLRDVWIPWSDGLAFIGINGSGKSNILEVLTVLLGTSESRHLGTGRFDEEAAIGSSVFVRNDPLSLPTGPESLLRTGLNALGQAGEQLVRDLQWWRHEGVESGETFAEAVHSWAMHSDLRAQVLDAVREPLVRYTLQATSREHAAGGLFCNDCDEFREESAGACAVCGSKDLASGVLKLRAERLFRRTLLSAAPLGDLQVGSSASMALALTGEATQMPGEHVALVELPLSNRPPATLQWLPRTRSSEEVVDSLNKNFRAALRPVQSFVESVVAALPVTQEAEPGDGHWWLHRVAEAAANGELELTAPGLRIDSAGESDAHWNLGLISSDGAYLCVGSTREDYSLDGFSAGQRRWMDEALATASRILIEHAERMALFNLVLGDLDDDAAIDAVANAAREVERAEAEGYWSDEALTAVLRALEPDLVEAARSKDAPMTAGVRALIRAVLPAFNQLDRGIVIRVFDEPEAHLHPRAQRPLARALQTLRNQGQNIVIATHSPPFLDNEGWAKIHVASGRVKPIPDASVMARSALARDLGLTHGELLLGVQHILIVEGDHDELMLRSFFGRELREAGVLVIKMHGTDNLLGAVSLGWIEQYLHVPVTVMLDNTRRDRVERNKPESDEEVKVVQVRSAVRASGNKFAIIGLTRPDVTCYLNERAVKRSAPESAFGDWRTVIDRFRRLPRRSKFKDLVRDEYGIDLTSTKTISAIIDLMIEENLAPVEDFTREISGLIANVYDGEGGRGKA